MMQKRVNVYIDEQDHKKIKAELASRGMTLSEWLRLQVAKFIKALERDNDN